ncbi:MAG: TIM44-like domain-containing protein [Candidatus Avoscillospira sp.]
MAKRIFRRLLLLLLCLSVLFLLVLPCSADFGDFSGDSDYDYSSSDSSYDYDYDDDDYDSSFDASGASGLGTYGLPVICVGIWLLIGCVKNKRKANRSETVPTAQRNLVPMGSYHRLDPGFREDDLTAKISNLYVQMQNAWTQKDITVIRPHCTDHFYTQMERQLEQKRQQHETNYVERIAVLGVTLDGFTQTGGNDVIYATVRTRIIDYTLNDDTGKLVSGSRTQEKFMTYEWELVRQSGVTTQAEAGQKTVNCPNCGAPVELNASAKCLYCGSVITADSRTFVLNGIRGISQKTS